MAPHQKDKTDTSKMGIVRRLYRNLTQDVAKMRDHLKQLNKKMRFLQVEALLHQTQLSLEHPDFRTLGPKHRKLQLCQERIELLQKRRENQKLVCLGTLVKVDVAMERIEGMDEGLEDEEQDKQTSTGQITEKGVMKLWSVEGTIGEHIFSSTFLANYNVDNPRGKIDKVGNLLLSPSGGGVQKMITPARVSQPKFVNQFISDLSFFQILRDEREETVSHLESDIPNLEIERILEPLVIKFLPTHDHEINILWAIVWDSRNNRFKYRIAVNCDDEVPIRYSSSNEVYPFLSGRKQLRERQEVVEFIEAFLDL